MTLEKLVEELLVEIRVLMTRQQLTQQDLAKKMGISSTVVSRILSGKHIIRLDTLFRIAQALGKELEVKFIDPQ